jgi:hypothetical protein
MVPVARSVLCCFPATIPVSTKVKLQVGFELSRALLSVRFDAGGGDRTCSPNGGVTFEILNCVECKDGCGSRKHAHVLNFSG